MDKLELTEELQGQIDNLTSAERLELAQALMDQTFNTQANSAFVISPAAKRYLNQQLMAHNFNLNYATLQLHRAEEFHSEGLEVLHDKRVAAQASVELLNFLLSAAEAATPTTDEEVSYE